MTVIDPIRNPENFSNIFTNVLESLTYYGASAIAAEEWPEHECECCGDIEPHCGTIAFKNAKFLAKAHIILATIFNVRVRLHSRPHDEQHWCEVDLDEFEEWDKENPRPRFFSTISRSTHNLFNSLNTSTFKPIPVHECCNTEDECGDTPNHATVESSKGFAVDIKIAPLLEDLWKINIPTLCSCGGDDELLPFVSIAGHNAGLRAYLFALENVNADMFHLEYRGDEGHEIAEGEEYTLILE